jgi:hypothetical protein
VLQQVQVKMFLELITMQAAVVLTDEQLAVQVDMAGVEVPTLQVVLHQVQHLQAAVVALFKMLVEHLLAVRVLSSFVI